MAAETFERGHAIRDRSVRWRSEDGVAGTAAAQPVLRSPELARILAAAAAAGEENAMNLAYEAIGQRQSFAQAHDAVLERGDVVGYFHYIIQRDARRLVELEQQQVRERRLRALDLRGKHSLLADVRVEEE